MATVIGDLREGKATYGEKTVLYNLKTHLPKEFTVYAECPVVEERQDVHPDFIVLTNYGIIVLEVKDWKTIQKVDAFHAYVYTSATEVKRFPNPVETVRDYAQSLKNKFRLHKEKYNSQVDDNIPFGYAVVMADKLNAQKTSLQRAWGENYLFNLFDLNPGLITKRIRETIPLKHITVLTKAQMDLARSVINPEITIQNITLDTEQEKLVMEGFSQKESLKKVPVAKPKPSLFATEFGYAGKSQAELDEANLPEENKKIVGNSSIRLVRGEMGSGKTIVLKARARYLSKNNPEWKILVLTFNKDLAQDIKKALRSCKNIEVNHLHEYISSTLRKINNYEWRGVQQEENWIKSKQSSFPIIADLGPDYVADEIKWIQEVMVASRDQYQKIKRVGRGTDRQITAIQRDQIYDVLDSLNRYLDNQRQFSWETLVLYFLDKLRKSEIVVPPYDAILIDEAQDFAPSWIAIVNHLLKENGQLFMVDDPKQSIFRFFTWRQKGIEVVGRTRRLKVPYRNTLQIFTAADAIIKGDQTILERLKSEGDYSEPDLSNHIMRSGDKPLLIHATNQDEEIKFIESKINGLRQNLMIPYDQMVIIHPKPFKLASYKKCLAKYNVIFHACKTVKSLDFEVAFFCGLENFFADGMSNDPATISHQRSLVYTCMGRPRNHLFLIYSGFLAKHFDVLDDYVTKLDI